MTKSKGNGDATGCPFTKKTVTGCPFTKKNITPCPVLNILMNMGLLDSKKKWTTQNVQDALKKIQLSEFTSYLLANGANRLLEMNNLPFSAKSLQTHDVLEHDSSMSREDYHLGNHIHYNKKRFDLINKYFSNQKDITLKEFAEYRYSLCQKSIKENANVNLGINQYFSIGLETCAIFILLSEDDKLSLKKLRRVFEKETLDNVKINSIDMPILVSCMIQFASHWVNASYNNKALH